MKSAILLCFFLTNGLFSQTLTVKLWPHGVPGSKAEPAYKQYTILDKGRPRVYDVTDPELIVFLPAKTQANGTAVVICPGGAYARLAVDHEGYDVAAWLTTLGVAGIVLIYRLPSDSIMQDKSVGPLQDVQEAIRTVRRKSKEWGIDPGKVGVMGFSAGGNVAGTASTLFKKRVYEPTDTTNARPDFSLLMYGVLSMEPEITHKGSFENLLGKNPSPELIHQFSSEEQVTSSTPPAFIVHAADDHTVPVENSIRYFKALRTLSIPAELHIYEQGGHGFGLAPNGGTESTWPEACRQWLKHHGWL